MMDPSMNFSFPPVQPHLQASMISSNQNSISPGKSKVSKDYAEVHIDPNSLETYASKFHSGTFGCTNIPDSSLNFSSFCQFPFQILMPGTIQVSVMEFKGLPSASTSSTFLKVSLGKREYQTSDTGDFSFPLTTLRDNLVVGLLDAEGNEIALTGIQTMSIVEKVCWDEIFPLQGGGQVHLKLQFILNEDERNRIRLKREAAVKKNQESIPNISQPYLEITSSAVSSVPLPPQAEQKVSDSQTRTVLKVASLDNVDMPDSLLPTPDVFPAGSQSTNGREGGSNPEQGNPKATDKKEGTSSASKIYGTEAHQIAFDEKLETQPSTSKVDINLVSGKKQLSDSVNTGFNFSEKSRLASLRQEDDRVDKSQQQGPQEKNPSNVRKLVSAFESSLFKDVKTSNVRSEPMKVGKGGHLEDCEPKEVIEQSSISKMSSMVTKASGQSLMAADRPVEKELDTSEWTESTVQLEISSTTEKASTSGRTYIAQSERAYSFRFSAGKQYSGATSYAEGRGRTNSTKIDILVASFDRSKSLEFCEEENFYSENSGMWIFPNDTKHLCVTTAGKRVMNLLGNGPAEAKFHQTKRSSFPSGDTKKHGSDNEMKKHQKESHSPRKARSENSSNDALGGFFGQVIKIAIVVGFGAFVFFARQREPRKSKRDKNELFFTTSDYMDGKTTIAEQVEWQRTKDIFTREM